MSLNTAETIYLVVGLIDFGGIFIWPGVSLHLAYTRMDEMLESLKNCTVIMQRSFLRHGGLLGKILLIGGISGMVTFPGVYLKHGGVCVDDLKNFPAPLKRKLVVMQWILIALLVVMILLGIVASYMEPIK